MIEKAKKRGKSGQNSDFETIKTSRRKTVLQMYYDAGYLDIVESKFSADDRLKVGEMLAQDYFLGNYSSLQTARLKPVNIKTTGERSREMALFFKERYLRAIRVVPAEFWPVVRRVCVEDLPILSNDATEVLRKYKIYHQKILLNYGLDRLIYFYYKKSEKF